MVKPLSPAAQAVLDAALDVEFRIEFTDLEATMKASVQRANAAALRAAALYCKRDSVILLSIADELEGATDE